MTDAEQRLASAQQAVNHWMRVAASPNLSPRAVAVAQRAAMSAKAEVRLRTMALAYERDRPADEPELATRDWHLNRVLSLYRST
jgi:hypothetical protein